MELKGLSTIDLIRAHSEVLRELKKREIIQSKNVIGDLGEYYAINHYVQTAGLSKLMAAPKGAKNVDALSRDGERYSIKSTTAKTTGAFYGMQPPDSDEKEKQVFEYVVVVMLDDDYFLKAIYELTWDQFLEFRHWASRIQAYNLSLTKELLSTAKCVFNRDEMNS